MTDRDPSARRTAGGSLLVRLTADPPSSICPGCTLRDAGEHGLCEECMVDRYATERLEREASERGMRRAAWAERSQVPSASKLATRERQRRHRLLERVRPGEPVPPGADPLELAQQALVALAVVRTSVRSIHPEPVAALDRVAELIRQLAWGPERRP